MLDVYSGHGSSEVYVDLKRPTLDEAGIWSCPAATDEIEFCCERAGTLARQRSVDPISEKCEQNVSDVFQAVAALGAGPRSLQSPSAVLPDTTPSDWGECDQLGGEFRPAWNYRPRQTAQYALALGSVDGRAVENRFRFGIIASSDNHRGRPGTGYKEKGRLVMTDGVGYPLVKDIADARSTSFYYGGGLAAVHAERRDRDSIFESLKRHETYGTSGDRILLWFDHLAPGGSRIPMGSVIPTADREIRFQVRALGAQKQKVGCPSFVHEALTAERIASLCLNECHHPSDERKRITKIEVVRVTDAVDAEGARAIIDRVEDPWRVFECSKMEDACEVEFSDTVDSGLERAYDVRAIQEASPAINGDPLRCTRDEAGTCIRSRLCDIGSDGKPDDCLSLVDERAWSFPIWIQPI